MRQIVWTVAAIALVAPTFAAARSEPPTPTDLKAAFCSGYWQDMNFNPVPCTLPDAMCREMESGNREVASTMARIDAYLSPRIWQVDPYALKSAIDAGVAFKATVRASIQPCANDPKFEECQVVFQKVAECRSGSFLPF